LFDVSGPLAGLRVIDLTQVLSGPFCTMLLADLGADVIKVEPPDGDVARQWGPRVATSNPPVPGTYGGYFASVNRNKRSVCIDLKQPAGRESLLDLLGDADVFVENFRVGVMDRFGLSYGFLHERFPKLVYACIRGFGDPLTGESPYAGWPAFDIIAQAMGGIMGVTGPDADHPVKVGPGVGDIFPAALAAFGLLAAVRHAERTGVGQFVDVAMYDSVLALTERIVYQYSMTGVSPVPQGNTHPLLCPYGAIRTADGFVSVASPSDHHWRLFAAAIGRAELGVDPLFATNAVRVEHSAHVYGVIEQWSMQLPTAQVVARLGGVVPCAPVNTAADIAADPHVAARDMIVSLPHPDGGEIDVVGTPIKLTETPAQRFVRAPLLGEHTAEVLNRYRRDTPD
jgi:crotonobetainyl-CoA:carnitine CoA-transferase CaiB-like acyl-CoA transferase